MDISVTDGSYEGGKPYTCPISLLRPLADPPVGLCVADGQNDFVQSRSPELGIQRQRSDLHAGKGGLVHCVTYLPATEIKSSLINI